MLGEFIDAYAPQMDVFTDPSRTTYRTAGLRSGLGGLSAAGRTVSNGIRAFRAGHRQRGVKGDAFQLGGIVAVESSGRVVFEHRDRAAGDIVEIDTVLNSFGAPAGASVAP
jgi:hypothetical protein